MVHRKGSIRQKEYVPKIVEKTVENEMVIKVMKQFMWLLLILLNPA